MDEWQHRTVQKFRSQIDELKRELEKLSAGASIGPSGEPSGRGSLSNPAALKAQDKLAQKREEYARYRLCEGLGGDPIYVEDDLLSQVLRDLIRGSRLASLNEDRLPMRISPAARQGLLLSLFSFADALGDHSKSATELLSFLNERSPVKDALRRWSAQIRDPYVQGTLEKLQQLARNFENTVVLLRRRLDKLRRRYETEKDAVDYLAVERVEGRTLVHATNDWSNLVSNFPDDVQSVYGIYRTLEKQLGECEEIKGLLNGEIRKFMASLVPLYLALVEQQSKNVRRSILGGAKASPKLTEQLVREAKQTDYLIPGSGLPVPHLKIPKEYTAIGKLSGYLNFARTVGVEEMRSADTVEFPTNR